MLKIAFTGPESTGKSTLSYEIASHFRAHWCQEFAREYLEQLNRSYEQSDLLHIAKKQFELMQSAPSNSKLLVCDTEMLVIKIWSEFKYGTCAEKIESLWQNQEIDHYFLCDIDTPWTPDPLREHPNHRRQLFDLYKSALEKENKAFTVLSGSKASKITLVQKILRDKFEIT